MLALMQGELYIGFGSFEETFEEAVICLLVMALLRLILAHVTTKHIKTSWFIK